MKPIKFFEAAITVSAATFADTDDWPTGSTSMVDCATTAVAFIAVDDKMVAGAASTEGRHRWSSWSLCDCQGSRSPLSRARRRQKSFKAEKNSKKKATPRTRHTGAYREVLQRLPKGILQAPSQESIDSWKESAVHHRSRPRRSDFPAFAPLCQKYQRQNNDREQYPTPAAPPTVDKAPSSSARRDDTTVEYGL